MDAEKDMVRSKKDGLGLITSFLILNVVSGTVGGAMQLVVPLYAMSLQATTAQIGVIRGISGLGMLLLVIPAGFLVDHFGSKKLFITGSLAGTLTTLALVTAKVPLAMTALLGFSGLFSSLKMTALNASFFRNLRDMGVEKAGWFKGSMSIGLTFLGPAFGAFLVAFENQGWFRAKSFKTSQGQRVRRLTILGILLLAGTGIMTLISHDLLRGDWVVHLPFTSLAVSLLPDIKFTVPLLTAAIGLWAAWRAVNYPTFADFLIATEAEMNKVSWTNRKRLVQDTIVVLVTVLMFSIFLLAIDQAWGFVMTGLGVVPKPAAKTTQVERCMLKTIRRDRSAVQRRRILARTCQTDALSAMGDSAAVAITLRRGTFLFQPRGT